MKGLNLSKFKKVYDDADYATLMSREGHQIKIAKKPLSHLQRKQIESLDLHKLYQNNYADGGGVKPSNDSLEIEPVEPVKEQPLTVEPVGSQTERIPTSGQEGNRQIAGTGMDQTQLPKQQAPFLNTAGKDLEAIGKQQVVQSAVTGEAQKAQAIQNTQNEIRNLQSPNKGYQQHIADLKNRDDFLYNQIMQGINKPSDFWDNHSKVAAAIGILISSAGQALGRGQVPRNAALDQLNLEIENSIKKDKNQQDNTMNLYKINNERLHNAVQANIATTNDKYTALKYELDKISARENSSKAKGELNALKGQIQQATDMNNHTLALQRANDIPIEQKIPYLANVIPDGQKHAPEALKELNDISVYVANSPRILDAFFQAASDTNVIGEGAGGLRTLNPFRQTPGQLAFDGEITRLTSMITDSKSQTEMEQARNTKKPTFFDSQDDKGSRLKDLVDFLATKAERQANTKALGLDANSDPRTRFSRQDLVNYVAQTHPEYLHYLLENKSTLNNVNKSEIPQERIQNVNGVDYKFQYNPKTKGYDRPERIN